MSLKNRRLINICFRWCKIIEIQIELRTQNEDKVITFSLCILIDHTLITKRKGKKFSNTHQDIIQTMKDIV